MCPKDQFLALYSSSSTTGDYPAMYLRAAPCLLTTASCYDHCSGINGESPCCRLGNDIPRLDTWASEWCTTFNASKSAHMLITGNRRLRNFSRPVSSLSISGDFIPWVRSTVHLGICLSSTLSWSEHITRLIIASNSGVHAETSCPSPWFRKPCHTPLSKSRSPFS